MAYYKNAIHFSSTKKDCKNKCNDGAIQDWFEHAGVLRILQHNLWKQRSVADYGMPSADVFQRSGLSTPCDTN